MATPMPKVDKFIIKISPSNIDMVVEKISPDLDKLEKELQPDVVGMTEGWKSRISHVDRARMIIHSWIQRHRRRATTEKLAEALMNIGRKELADELVKNTQVKQPEYLTETEIQFIVDNIGNEWIRLAAKLGLSESDVTGIKQGPGSLKEKVYQVIVKWKHNKGDDATKDDMIDCLDDIERRDIVNKLSFPIEYSEEDILQHLKRK